MWLGWRRIANFDALSKIVLSGFGMLQDFFRRTLTEHSSTSNHITSIGNSQCFPNLVISDENRYTLVSQFTNDRLNTVDRDRINARKWLVQENDPRT